jgi:uncharacterized membrane protein YebE (DUF533 family)
MFDARSILDAIVAGSSEQTRQARESGGLSDIMSDILKDLPKGGDTGAPAPRYQPQQPAGGGGHPGDYGQAPRAPDAGAGGDNPLGDLLRKLGGGEGGEGGGLGDILRKLGGGEGDARGGSSDGGGLGDILRKLGGGEGDAHGGGSDGGGLGDILRKLGGGEGDARGGGSDGGSLGDILRKLGGGEGGEGGGLGDILGKLARGDQPDQGGQPGRAGGDDPLGDILGRLGRGGSSGQPAPRYDQGPAAGGPGYGDMLERIKDLVVENKGAAGAIIGGLGGLLLGTRAGRSLVGSAVKVGGLALIGMLAYRALKNYQQGAPVDGGRVEVDRLPQPPQGSGFDADSMGHDEALLFIRTMVAAAAADGTIDRAEQQRILGQLEQAGMDKEAMDFLASEFNQPARIDDLVGQVRSPEQAVEVYTAARIAIEPDTREEQAFLADLASRLRIDNQLQAHVDAAAAGIKVR